MLGSVDIFRIYYVVVIGYDSDNTIKLHVIARLNSRERKKDNYHKCAIFCLTFIYENLKCFLRGLRIGLLTDSSLSF